VSYGLQLVSLDSSRIPHFSNVFSPTGGDFHDLKRFKTLRFFGYLGEQFTFMNRFTHFLRKEYHVYQFLSMPFHHF